MDYPTVLVRWRDATSEYGHIRFDALSEKEPDVIETVGFLALYNTEKLVLANGVIQGGDHVQDCTVIPAGWINSVTPLGFGEYNGEDEILPEQEAPDHPKYCMCGRASCDQACSVDPA